MARENKEYEMNIVKVTAKRMGIYKTFVFELTESVAYESTDSVINSDNFVTVYADSEIRAVVKLREFLRGDLSVRIFANFTKTTWSGGDNYGNGMKEKDSILETVDFANEGGWHFDRFDKACYDKKQALSCQFELGWENQPQAVANLTQHACSQEQVEAGVVDVEFPKLSALLTFNEIPSKVTMGNRAVEIARFASQSGFKTAMIGGAPFFMSTLEKALIDAGIKAVYAFSVRDSIEKDGIKTSVFRHAGFVGGE